VDEGRYGRAPSPEAVARGAGVVAAAVPHAVWAVHAVPSHPRGHPARGGTPVGVLPGGVALQVRQQALHAMIPMLLNKTVETTTTGKSAGVPYVDYFLPKFRVRSYKTYKRGGRMMDVDGRRAIG